MVLVRYQNNLFYITQVKSTLTQKAIKSAIEEVLEVDKFLESLGKENSQLRQSFRFKICCRQLDRRLQADKWLNPANLSAEELGFVQSQATRWEQIRTQVFPVAIDADPFLRLVIRLFPHIPKVFEFLERVIGVSIDFLSENRSSEELCSALTRILVENKEKFKPPGQILGPADFRDQSKGQLYVLLGHRPKLEDLNKGCFMDRPDLLTKIMEEYRSIAHPKSGDLPDRKISVLWIKGASGGGKSALLLQMIRAL